jgi:hypothetical protein
LLAELSAELKDDTQAGRVRTELTRFSAFVRERLMPCTTAKDASVELPYWLADDFLRALAMLLMAWAWARIGDAEGAESPRWQTTQSGFWRWVWPEFDMRLATMELTIEAI